MISEKEVLDVREPPGRAMGKIAELWKPVEGTNKIMCTACARYCKIGEGQVGLCGIRGVHEGKLWLYVYGRVITGHVDPIEKKPVSHYRPGSKIFSIATRGWTPAGLLRKGDKVLLAREGRSPFPRKGHVIRLPQHSLDCHGETVARFWELMQQWEFSGSRYEWASVNSIRPESPKESVYSF